MNTDRIRLSSEPTSDSRPRSSTGPLLLASSCIPVLCAVVITPVLPDIQDHFASVPDADTLVPLALALPYLVIAVMSPLAGQVLDRAGRRLLLLAGLLLITVAGLAPLWFTGLDDLLISRAVAGVASAAVMVSATTLIGDYYSGPNRNRFFGLQAVTTTVAAMVFFALGGALGDLGWRTPFWLFCIALVPALFTPSALPRYVNPEWEPSHRRLARLPWRTLLPRLAVTVFGAIVFYTPIVQTSYLLDDLEILSAQTIGLVSALSGVATVIGSIVYINVAQSPPAPRFAVVFCATAVGFVVVASSGGAVPAVAGPIAVLGLVIASVGCGLLLPTLLTWSLSSMRYTQRGRATGWWTGSYFLGQFIATMLVPVAARYADGVLWTFAVLAIPCAFAAVVAIGASLRPATAHASHP